MQVLTNRSSWRNQGCFSQDLQQGVVKQKVIFHYQFSKIKKYVFEIYILKTIYYNWNKSIYCQIFFAWHNLQEATLWCILLEVSCCHLPGCNPRKSLTDALVTAACCIFFSHIFIMNRSKISYGLVLLCANWYTCSPKFPIHRSVEHAWLHICMHRSIYLFRFDMRNSLKVVCCVPLAKPDRLFFIVIF